MSFLPIRDLKYYERLPYQVVVEEEEYTDGSKCFRAYHPELPGCSSHGETKEEAIEDLKEAKRFYLETLISQNQKIPLPKLPFTIGTAVWSSKICTFYFSHALKPENISGHGKIQSWDLVHTV